jgi:hypothetical protein
MTWMRATLPVLCLSIILAGCYHFGNNSNMDSSENNLGTRYALVKGKVYNVLIDEYFDTDDPVNDPRISEIKRVYKVYDGNEHNIYKVTDSIGVSNEFRTIAEARKYLIENDPDLLRLRPTTIVSLKVISDWQRDGYDAEHEYWSDSPKGLTYSDLTK